MPASGSEQGFSRVLLHYPEDSSQLAFASVLPVTSGDGGGVQGNRQGTNEPCPALCYIGFSFGSFLFLREFVAASFTVALRFAYSRGQMQALCVLILFPAAICSTRPDTLMLTAGHSPSQ